MSKAIICVDFDGVIHGYQSGWQGSAATIIDPPVPGAMEWLWKMAQDPKFSICVYSSRSKDPGGIEAMKDWLFHHLRDYWIAKGSGWNAKIHAQETLDLLSFPTQKPAASMTIDDRAFCFNGTFPTAEWLKHFKPWNKSPKQRALTPEREAEYRAALADTPMTERDGADHVISELFEEIDYLRGLAR